MSSRHATFRLVVYLVLALSLAFSFAAPVANATDATKKEIVVQVGIPNLTHNCTAPEHIDEKHPEKPKLQCVDNLGDYIGILYRFLSGVIGVIAAVMIMWGGFKWLTASGNSGRVSDAKDVIYSAIVAILLVLGSYILLVTINPQLVNLSLPGINSVVKIEQASAVCGDNPINSIDFGGVDCNGGECCGKEFKVNTGGGTSVPCIWLTCQGALTVCRTTDSRPDRTSAYGCVVIDAFCRENNSDDQCIAADVAVQKQRASDNSPKFVNLGCSRENVSGGFDEGCKVNILFSAFPRVSIAYPAGYQPNLIDCFTPGAEGVCWKRDTSKKAIAEYCNQSLGQKAKKCSNPLSSPRPVAGVQGGCLVKQGRTGSTNPDDYLCWQVPGAGPSVNDIYLAVPHP